MTVQYRLGSHFRIRPKPIDALGFTRCLRCLGYAGVRHVAERFDNLTQSFRLTQVYKVRHVDFLADPIFHRF